MAEHEQGRPRFQLDNLDQRSSGRAVVLVPILKRRDGSLQRSDEARLEEAVGLARAIELEVVESGTVPITTPRAATLLGTGKIEEFKGIIAASDAAVVIVDHPLTPVQQRNLEKAWDAKVLDRTGLILEIFGARAQTKEGRLQVELAQLSYQRGRLVRSWTHLERQRGGAGFMGGPGETQIESDRRELQGKINKIERELETVRRTRSLHRSKRKRVPHPIVALVGYTNAGKSTLFNRLTDSDVFAQDLLFATLDPTLRRLKLPSGSTVILSDTVGFVSELPTNLIAAFRATLEEVLEADLILHVRDIADPDSSVQAADVMAVLSQLGVEDETRILEVWNKIDRLEPDALERIRETRTSGPVLVSAVTGEGVDELLQTVEQRITGGNDRVHLSMGPEEGAAISWLYENAHVAEREDGEEGRVELDVLMTERTAGQFKRLFPR